MTRPAALADGDYDVVVIGGGMAGAGVARDLALRGVSVALVEKGDFAGATTSRSSKLIHGGLRYLELFDVALVRESLRERETLNRLAPHLVRPLPFLVPIYRDASRGLIKVRIGLTLYDWLTPGRGRERYRVLRPIDTLSLEPAIRAENLRGAGYYVDDLLVFPERLCLENVLSACRHGARAFNYAQVEEVVHAPGSAPAGVRVRDLVTGRVATLGARALVNATGPWVDELRALAGVQERGPRIVRLTKGIHCLLPRLTDHAVYHSTSDDRMIFMIPWREFSLVGTTDTDFDGDLERVHATGDEVSYLLGEVRRVLPDPRVAVESVAYTYAGVRPLSYEEGRRVEAHTWLDVSAEVASSGLARETLETLVMLYGRAYPRVIDLAGNVPGGADRLCPRNPDIVAQLHLAVQDEMAVSLQDFLLRRTGIGTSRCQGTDCAEPIGRRMGQLLGWTPRRLEAELDAYRAHVARSRRFRTA